MGPVTPESRSQAEHQKCDENDNLEITFFEDLEIAVSSVLERVGATNFTGIMFVNFCFHFFGLKILLNTTIAS